MPRPLRIHVPGAIYHVTLRGNHREDIFFCADDRALLSAIIAEALERFQARLHAYCFMTNHIHALIQVSDVPLSRLMMRIAGLYARRVQKGLGTTGHLFEKRYYPVLVDADEYLLELLRYIHLNPVRAHLVASADEYPWTSHHAYLDRRDEPWVHTEFAWRMFAADRERAVAAYRRFVTNSGSSVSSPLLDCNHNDRRILGSDDFAARLLGRAWRPRSRKSLDQLISEACSLFAVTQDGLRSCCRAQVLVKARAWVAHQALCERICSLAEVARRFDRDESSLRHGVRAHFNYP
jgi:REP element-mobilizing transposase RayT